MLSSASQSWFFSLDPIHKESYDIEWVRTSWTDSSTLINHLKNEPCIVQKVIMNAHGLDRIMPLTLLLKSEYCMSKKSRTLVYSEYGMEIGQDFFEIQYGQHFNLN